MKTKNFDGIVRYGLYYDASNCGPFIDYTGTEKDNIPMDGSQRLSTIFGSAINNVSNTNLLAQGQRVVMLIGNGTTPPTYNDYNIESSLSGYNEWSTIVKSKRDCHVVYRIQNNTSDNLIVNEIGLFVNFSYSGNTLSVMIYREILHEPVTIAPNGIKEFTVMFSPDENSI